MRDANTKDIGGAALCGVAALALYASTLQSRPCSDGAGLLALVQYATQLPDWLHPLYLWIGYAARSLLPDVPTFDILRGMSALSGAFGVAALFLLLRATGVARARSAALAAVLAFAPAVWFFSTTVELHALHMACVMGAVLVIVHAPWRHTSLALAVSCLPLPLVFSSHQSGVLLGPGLVLMARWAAARQGRPLPWRTTLTAVAPAFALALLLGASAAELIRGGGGLGIESGARFTVEYLRGPDAAVLLWGWLYGLGALGPAALAGVVTASRSAGSRPPIDRQLVAALVVSVVPSLLFFVVFGFPELGAYFVHTAPLYAVLASRVPVRRWTGVAFAAAIALQVLLGARWLRDFDTAEWKHDQLARASAIDSIRGDGPAFVLVVDPRTPLVEPIRPQIREVSLFGAILRLQGEGADPSALIAEWKPYLDALLATPGAFVLLDRTYQADASGAGLHGEWIEALESYFSTAYAVSDESHRGWPLWSIRQSEG